MCCYIYIYRYMGVYSLSLYIYIHNHGYFSGGTIPKCKIHFWGPPFKCKIGRWTSPRCRFCGGGCQNTFKLQNVSLHFHGPPQKHIEKCSLHFGHVPPLKGSWLYIYIHIFFSVSVICLVFKLKDDEGQHWSGSLRPHGWAVPFGTAPRRPFRWP